MMLSGLRTGLLLPCAVLLVAVGALRVPNFEQLDYVPAILRPVGSDQIPSAPDGAYVLSFWLFPEGTRAGWSSIVQRREGHSHSEGAPSVWITPGGHQMLFCAGSLCRYAPALPNNPWTLVTMMYDSTAITVSYNAAAVALSATPPQGVTAHPDPSSTSSTYEPAKARLSRFQSRPTLVSQDTVTGWLAENPAPEVDLMQLLTVSRGQLVLTAQQMSVGNTPDYTVAFWIKQFPGNGWSQLFTRSAAVDTTIRNPGVWLLGGNVLGIRASPHFSNHGDFGIDTPALESNRWYHIAFTRKDTSLRVFVDGTLFRGMNEFPMNQFADQALYMNHPWVQEPLPAVSPLLAHFRYRAYVATDSTIRAWSKLSPDTDLLGPLGAVQKGRLMTVPGPRTLSGEAGEPTPLLLTASAQWTLSFWIKASHYPSSETSVLHHGDPNADGYPRVVMGNDRLWISGNGMGPHQSHGLTPNQWTHIAIVRHQDLTSVYWDGHKNFDQASSDARACSVSAPLYLGSPKLDAAPVELDSLRHRPMAVSDALIKQWAAEKPNAVCLASKEAYRRSYFSVLSALHPQPDPFTHFQTTGHAEGKEWPQGLCDIAALSLPGPFTPASPPKFVQNMAVNGTVETWSFWVKPTSNSSEAFSSVLDAPGFRVFMAPRAGGIFIQTSGFDGKKTVQLDGPKLTTNTWAMVTYVRSLDGCSLYYNADVPVTFLPCQPQPAMGGPLYIATPGLTSSSGADAAADSAAIVEPAAVVVAKLRYEPSQITEAMLQTWFDSKP